jgi:hypothetical protein
MRHPTSGALIILCSAAAAALAPAQADEALLLSAQQMDGITAGATATFGFNSVAVSGLAANTFAKGLAATLQAALPGQPQQQAVVSVSMGHANAVAVGDSPAVASSIAPVTNVGAGPANYASNFGMQVVTPNASLSLGWSYSAVTTANPWALTGL